MDPMGSIDGWVDPEIEAMQNMIHGAIDASFEDRNRAKEGVHILGLMDLHARQATRPFACGIVMRRPEFIWKLLLHGPFRSR